MEAKLTVITCDLRRSKRKRVLMRAAVISTDGLQQVRIKDLTADGAGISCQSPLARGSDVVLKLKDLFVAARVVWAEGMRAGLEFYRQLPLEELADAPREAAGESPLWPRDSDNRPDPIARP
jgi:hypothetical protein